MQGDPQVVELLNEVLTAELTAVNQYFLDAKMFDNWGYERLAERFRSESIDEMKDADHLIERKLAKADLRRSVVSISAKGLRLIEAVAPTSEAIYAAITRRYGARKLAELQDMLHTLEHSLSELGVAEGQSAESDETE